VFVVGATGRIGHMVVDTLSARGVQVVAMVRDAGSDRAQSLLALPGGANVILAVGDLNDSEEALARLLAGCSACISCSGASRLTKATDLLADQYADPRHPYNVNYKGIERLCAAMKTAGCRRLVRVTVNALGKSAFFPFTVLLNAVLSMTTKWQYAGENAIRASGVEYTIVRPPKLVDDDRSSDVHLRLTDRGTSGAGLVSISRAEVAALVCQAYDHPAAVNTTLTCKWGEGADGAQEWGPLLQAVTSDAAAEPGVFGPKPFRAAIAAYATVAAVMGAVIIRGALTLLGAA